MIPQNPRHSVVRRDDHAPEDFTRRHSLFCLYALQQWECLPVTATGPYKSGYFYNHYKAFVNGLETTSRTIALRLLSDGKCLACGATYDPLRSKHDHLIPRALGGPDDLGNAWPLCRSCNSSKGTRDGVEWWVIKGYDTFSLPRQALCVYCRANWQYLAPELLDAPAPARVAQFLVGRATALPSDDHREALYGSCHLAGAFYRWAKEPQRLA